MRVSKANLCAQVASKTSGRWVLTGIRFDKKGTVSADGFKMLFVPYPEGEADFEPVTIDAKMVGIAGRQIHKSKITDNETPAIVTVEDGTVRFDVNGLSLILPQITQAYPDYMAIVPEGEPVTATAFTVKLLIDLLVQFKAMGVDVVSFNFYKKSNAVKITSGNEGPWGIIMPVNRRS